jgi:3-phosphoshikimate 1-carboxyvinyltransferase
MKNRPIGVLVDTLKKIGAHIEYIEKEGYPPLKLSPSEINESVVEIDGSISSQYITALLLIAPVLKNGLTLKIKNKLVSEAYVNLTLRIMEHFGIKAEKKELEIFIANQEYKGGKYFVEGDWSGASYWFELAALSDRAEVEVQGLSKNSLQGDSVVVEIYKQLGLSTEFGNNSIKISKTAKPVDFFEFDFNQCPDLVQTVVVTCAMLGIPFKISGAETLRIKETDRIHALQVELKKFGITIRETSHGVMEWDGKKESIETNVIAIDTYDDHRMAMAFAPVALKHKGIIINDPDVVVKSYPTYWEDLEKVGFGIERG